MNDQPTIRWNSIPFIRLSFFFIFGIVVNIYFPEALPYPFFFFGGCILLYILLVLLSSKKLKRTRKSLFGVIAFSVLFLFGYCLTEIRTEHHHPQHLSHVHHIDYYEGQLVSEIQQKTKSKKATLSISRVYYDSAWHQATGKVLLYMANTDSLYQAQYGDQLLIKSAPQTITPPANPAEFNYKRYLSFHQIHHQHFLKEGDYLFLAHQSPNPVFHYSLQFRQKADAIFKTYIRDQQSYSIATALVLGVKDQLDQTTKLAYASAGAMHVLAVSGLHVGILLKILMFLFGRINRIKGGKWLFTLLVISCLWLYAFITGLSPSVLRAVTMFSFITLGKTITRNTNIYNTLALSAFVLLCWNPYLIMGVGFQLSYVAVLGIVYLAPRFSALWQPKKPVLAYLWELTTVSVAAQLATFPIGLLYFHQFPTYFWASNFFVIIIAGIVLQLGIVLLALGLISSYLSDVLGWIINQLIWALNQLVFWIQDLPHALISQIDISIWETWLIYFVIFSLILFFAQRKIRYFYFVMMFSISFVSYQFIENYQQQQQKALLVYRTNKHANLCLINGGEAHFFGDSSLLVKENALRFHVKHHFWQLGIQQSNWHQWNKLPEDKLAIKSFGKNQLFQWLNQRICYYQDPHYQAQLEVDYLIVGHNAVKKWAAIETIQAKNIVFDASNSWYVVKKLLEAKNKPDAFIHDVNSQGAFFLDMDK